MRRAKLFGAVLSILDGLRLVVLPVFVVGLLTVTNAALAGGFVADAAAQGDPAALPVGTPPIDLGTWLLQVGPIGALVYGALLLGKTVGKGITVSVQVALPEREIELATRAVSALERIASPTPKPPAVS